MKLGIFIYRICFLYDNDYGFDEFGKVHEVSCKFSYLDRFDRWDEEDWEYLYVLFDVLLRVEVKLGIFIYRICFLYDNDYGFDEFGKVYEVSCKSSYLDRFDRWVVWVEVVC